MLLLTRKTGEAVKIGHDISVKVIKARANRVCLGIIAPNDLDIYREEIYNRILQEEAQKEVNKLKRSES